MFLINLSQANLLGYHLCRSVASPLLIRFQQGQTQLEVYNPNYLHAKSPVEVKKNESATVDALFPINLGEFIYESK